MSKIQTPQDLLDFENNNRYSSIGRMLVSSKQSAPSYGFGTASRAQAQTVYRDKNLLDKCKESPGPIYNIDNSQKAILPRDPSTKIGTSCRQKLNSTSYDHYQRQDIDFEPHQANNIRRPQATRVRFGIEQRFKTSFYSRNPGPQYDLTSHIGKDGPKYSVGVRREHSVSVTGSTPEIVGPGAYRLNQEMTTHFEDPPKISFTKAEKMQQIKGWDRHQTYFGIKSIGRQITSSKPTRPSYSFGRSSKEVQPNVLKKDLARQSATIRIDHPKF